MKNIMSLRESVSDRGNPGKVRLYAMGLLCPRHLTDPRNDETHKSFTLVELLIFMGLFSILIIVLVDIFVAILGVQTESQSVASKQTDTRFILSRLIYDINRADEVITPSQIGETTNSLQLKIDNINYLYVLMDNKLILEKNSIDEQLNGNDTNISSLSFKRLGNLNGKNTIKVNFSINDNLTHRQENQPADYQITVGLR